MQRIKPVFSIPVLILSVVLAAVLISSAALAQCTWMDNLFVVQAFNNPPDQGWFRSWDPRFDADWMWHYCGISLEKCPLGERGASTANDPDQAVRPGVNNAIRSDTCPSAHDIDCCVVCRRPVESCRNLGRGGLAHGPGCCG